MHEIFRHTFIVVCSNEILICLLLWIIQEINEKMREALKPEDLAEFAIEGEDERFAQAVGKGGPAAGALVSVKVWPALPLDLC